MDSFELRQDHLSSRQSLNNEVNRAPYIGFKGRMFPLIGSVVGSVGILLSYYIAVTNNPPDVKPFPWTDITHCGIHFPEYAVMRVGLLVAAVLFLITFEMLK